MTAKKADIKIAWSKDLAKPASNGRYAFYAILSSQPDNSWAECFKDIVTTFNKTGPFEAKLEIANHISHAIVFGELRAFENTLSVELEAAVSQTNDSYNRRMEQELNQQQTLAAKLEEDEKILESLKKKFVKE